MKLPISAFRKSLVTLLVVSLFTAGAFAQAVKITGKVTDSKTGEGIPGVSVVVKGTSNGTATNLDGLYSINALKGSTLVFSFVGYNTTSIESQGGSLNVQLVEATKTLDEVVVIGYGSVKKNDATGSVQAVSSKEFNRGSVTSPQELLAGKSAGVVITSNSGAPGDGSTIRIRGGSSLTASNDPLIVVDGVPLTSDVASGQSNTLGSINPNDIESFTILKDASATAIYGSRASNGVILITTKKSAGQKIQVDYNGTFNVNTVPKKVSVLNANEFKTLAQNEAGVLPGLTTADLALLGNSSTNWQDEIYRNAIGHNQNISISGKAGKFLPYRVSYGYTQDNGVLKSTNFDRNTIAATLNPSFLDDHLKVNINARGNFSKYNYGNQGAIGNALSFDPTQSIYSGNNNWGGYYTWLDSNNNPITIASKNPVALINQTDNRSNINAFIGNAQFDYKFHFLPELRANLNLGIDYTKSNGHNNNPTDAAFAYATLLGNVGKYNSSVNNKLLEFYLNYNKTFGVHNIDATLGYTWQHFYNESYSYAAKTDPSSSNLVVNTDITNKGQSYLISFFGRINYSLLDRYRLTFTLRNDASSKFASNQRNGLFPAAAFAWNINKENFLKDVSVLNELKLRLGYGVTGQQNGSAIGNWSYIPTWTISTTGASYQFGNQFVNTYRPNAYNANLKWEETTTYNVGLDFGFLNNRISGNIDVYQRKTKDLLANVPIPVGSNLSNYLITNVGDMKNKGVEFTLNLRPVDTKEWRWTVGYNLGYNKNEITKLSATNNPNAYIQTGSIGGGVGNTIQVFKVGEPINSFFVLQQVYGSNGMPIEGLYVDRSGQGGNVAANLNNFYTYKQPAPVVSMGFTSTLAYKQWDLFFTLRANIGNYVYNNVASNSAVLSSMFYQNYFNNLPSAYTKTMFVNPQYWSDFYIENGSFLRMDNISLGYNFKKLFTQRISGRISGTVQNAFIITKYSGLDPEVNNGIDNNIYPKPRIYTIGLSLSFK